MLAKLETYRKAIAAAAFGFLAMVAHFVPAVAGAVPPEAINAASVLAATLAAYWFENRVDGWNVTDAARWVATEIANLPEPEALSGPREG